MSGSEEQYRTASRFRDNYVDPALNNATYLGLQQQGFQNQADNIAKLGDVNARAEETIPGAITNAFQSYQGGQDRARHHAEQDQIMHGRDVQIKGNELTNEGIPLENENKRLRNIGQGTANTRDAATAAEEQADYALNNKVGANGLTNRETGYNARLANDVLMPKATQSTIDSNYGQLGLSRSRFDFDKGVQQRSEESQDYEAALQGIYSKLPPDQQKAAIDQLNNSGEFGHLRQSTLQGRQFSTESKVALGKIATHASGELAATSMPAYAQLMHGVVEPLEERTKAVEEMKAELARYQASTRFGAVAPGMENTDANSARKNIARLADLVIPGSGARILEGAPFTGVETRLQSAIDESTKRISKEYSDAKVHPDVQGRPEYTNLGKRIQALGSGQAAKQENTLNLLGNNASGTGDANAYAARVNGPPPQQQVVQGAPPARFRPSAVGTPLNAPGRR